MNKYCTWFIILNWIWMWEGRVRDVTLITLLPQHVSTDALPEPQHLFTCTSVTHKLTQAYTHSPLIPMNRQWQSAFTPMRVKMSLHSQWNILRLPDTGRKHLWKIKSSYHDSNMQLVAYNVISQNHLTFITTIKDYWPFFKFNTPYKHFNINDIHVCSSCGTFWASKALRSFR